MPGTGVPCELTTGPSGVQGRPGDRGPSDGLPEACRLMLLQPVAVVGSASSAAQTQRERDAGRPEAGHWTRRAPTGKCGSCGERRNAQLSPGARGAEGRLSVSQSRPSRHCQSGPALPRSRLQPKAAHRSPCPGALRCPSETLPEAGLAKPAGRRYDAAVQTDRSTQARRRQEAFLPRSALRQDDTLRCSSQQLHGAHNPSWSRSGRSGTRQSTPGHASSNTSEGGR